MVAMPNRALRLSPELIAAIQAIADAERRKWSDMARILLEEAVAARSKKAS
jgi:hypothetical protein